MRLSHTEHLVAWDTCFVAHSSVLGIGANTCTSDRVSSRFVNMECLFWLQINAYVKILQFSFKSITVQKHKNRDEVPLKSVSIVTTVEHLG